jgi:hypothetical protein
VCDGLRLLRSEVASCGSGPGPLQTPPGRIVRAPLLDRGCHEGERAAERRQGHPKGFAKQTRRAARRAVLLGALAQDGAATRLVGRSGLLPAPTAEPVEDLARSPRRFAQGVCTKFSVSHAPRRISMQHRYMLGRSKRSLSLLLASLGPIRPGLCRILHPDFREDLFHALR